MPKSWEFITPATLALKAALDALHPEFIKEAEAGGRKVQRMETVLSCGDWCVMVHYTDTRVHGYMNLNRTVLRKLGARAGEIWV